jgi:hypothetical protein
MSDAGKPVDGDNRTDPSVVLAGNPSEQEIARRHNQQVDRNLERFLYKPGKWFFEKTNFYGSAITAIATVAIACLTISIACDSTRQADIANGTLAAVQGQLNEMSKQSKSFRDQLTLAYPPKLVAAEFHMWKKGEGNPENPNNKIPSLTPGTENEGTIYVVNTGREVATILDSDLVATWRTLPLNMFNPAWEEQHSNRLSLYEKKPPRFDLKVTPKQFDLSPGEAARWVFGKIVPNGEMGTFYVIGRVTYQDRLGTRHDLAFARKYDPANGRFVKLTSEETSIDYESED